jgi:hypothetical protein
MARKKRSPEAIERVKKLRKQAHKIISRLDEHKLFGFILFYRGKKAIPELLELWGGVVEKDKGGKSEEESPESEEDRKKDEESVEREEVEPAEDLIELVAKKS